MPAPTNQQADLPFPEYTPEELPQISEPMDITAMPTNLPLTDSQKLRLANVQRKMLGKRIDAQQAEKEAQSLEQMLQRELAGIAALNHIDFTVSMLSEDFDIIPLPKR
jgi:hypothetical protein